MSAANNLADLLEETPQELVGKMLEEAGLNRLPKFPPMLQRRAWELYPANRGPPHRHGLRSVLAALGFLTPLTSAPRRHEWGDALKALQFGGSAAFAGPYPDGFPVRRYAFVAGMFGIPFDMNNDKAMLFYATGLCMAPWETHVDRVRTEDQRLALLKSVMLPSGSSTFDPQTCDDPLIQRLLVGYLRGTESEDWFGAGLSNYGLGPEDEIGLDPLLMAVASGYSHIAEWLVVEGQALVDTSDAYKVFGRLAPRRNVTPILAAAFLGDEQMVSMLIANGAKMRPRDLMVVPGDGELLQKLAALSRADWDVDMDGEPSVLDVSRNEGHDRVTHDWLASKVF